MAHHQSAKKRIRQTVTRRARNRYFGKTTRNAFREILAMEDKGKAKEKMPEVISMIDKLAKRNVIHRNKAANWKSQVMKHVLG